MEDNTKSKDQAGSTDAETPRIVELTPDMEIATNAGGKVIELTEALDGTADLETEDPALTPPQPSPQTPDKPMAVETESRTSDIEKEIDLAFESVQSPETQAQAEADGDKVSQLTDMADTVLSEKEQDHEDKQAFETEDAESDERETTDAGFEQEPGMTFELAPDVEMEAAKQPPVEEPLPEVEPQTLSAITEEPEDDAIDLVDIVEPPTPVAKTAEEDDDDIIELTRIVSTRAEADTEADEDDDIIELVNIVPTAAPEKTFTDEPAAQPVSADVEDDDPAGYNEQIIKLSDVLNEAKKRNLTPEEGDAFGLDAALTVDARPERDDETLDNLGMELDLPFDSGETQAEDLPEDKIEAAVERLLYTKYAPQIEKAIAQAVKRTVAREVEIIKRSLLRQRDDELDD